MSNQIYQYLQAVQAYISPPVTAVFLVGIFWKRATGKAAIITLIAGGVLGAIRFILDLVSRNHDLGGFNHFVEIPFLNYCIYAFILCCLILVTISLLTKESATKMLQVESIVISRGTFRKTKISTSLILNIIFSLFVAITTIIL
ncbi:MAG: sodium:solute symporter family transporter [Bacteroidota bacterium]